MRTVFSGIRGSAIALLFALALTLLSSLLARTGPELASYGNLCGPSHDQDCLEPLLNAGFPFAYLFDQPGISVERKLFFVEDEFRPIPFALNVAVYLILAFLLVQIAMQVRHALARRRASNDA
jgi:hypothetical protein